MTVLLWLIKQTVNNKSSEGSKRLNAESDPPYRIDGVTELNTAPTNNCLSRWQFEQPSNWKLLSQSELPSNLPLTLWPVLFDAVTWERRMSVCLTVKQPWWKKSDETCDRFSGVEKSGMFLSCFSSWKCVLLHIIPTVSSVTKRLPWLWLCDCQN